MTTTLSILILAALSPIILTYTTAVLIDGEPVAPNISDFRLPLTVLPQSYQIKLRPYLLESDAERRFTFDGEVYINVTINTTTRSLVLHAKNLSFALGEYWSTADPDTKIPLPKPIGSPVTDKLTFNLANALEVGTIYTIHFKYVGYMSDDMLGFYRSSYKNKNNETKWLGITQFEPNYARRAFPGFDEPKFKATFEISITRHNSMKAYSNTPLKSSSLNGNYYTDTFERTPLMSTYIIGFLISDFTERWDGELGVIARPEYYDQTEYSDLVVKEIIKEFNKYLSISYYSLGNHKLHLAAIPDFDSGAMENWGLVTYREKTLLYDYKSSTLRDKQNILETITHEVTHMWFGDFVTCEWWSYLWLNEGFARYMEAVVGTKVDQSLNMEQQFVTDVLQPVMVLDSTNKTNLMTNEGFNFTRDLSILFNSITYDRGASFIRMMKHCLGEQNFQESLQEYLSTHKYKNTVPANLLAMWEKYWPDSSKQQASLVFKSFTEQVGYPIVTVEVANDGKSMQISQKRFLLHADDGSDVTLLYTIPFTYTTNVENDFNTTRPKLFLQATKASTIESFEQPVEWVIANIQETGYYRVNYNAKNWQQIHRALLSPNWGGIHEMNRAQIVDDLFELALANIIDYDFVLPILGYLETELNYLPWKAALNGYTYLANRLSKDNKDFGIYIRQQLEKIYNQLGFDEQSNDSTFDIYNRAQVLSWSCKYGSTECITKAKEHFSTLMVKPVPANIRRAVYCTAMREGNETDFNILFNKYKDETVETERALILNALGCVKDYNLIEKYYKLILSENVRLQDKKSSIINLIRGSSENFMPLFTFVTRDFEKIATELKGYNDVASIIAAIALQFTEKSQENELKKFVEENRSKFGTSARSLEGILKTVAQNLDWSKDNLNKLKQYLEKRVRGGANVISPFKLLTMALVPLFSLIFC